MWMSCRLRSRTELDSYYSCISLQKGRLEAKIQAYKISTQSEQDVLAEEVCKSEISTQLRRSYFVGSLICPTVYSPGCQAGRSDPQTEDREVSVTGSATKG